MKIGIDLDGTITAFPELFEFLCRSFMVCGHEIHIITYRHETLRAMTEQQLDDLRIQYTKVWMQLDEEGLAFKQRAVAQSGVTVFFEDTPQNLAVMPPHVCRILIGECMQRMTLNTAINLWNTK